MKNFTKIFLMSLTVFNSCKQHLQTPFNEPPEWAKHAVWYQILVERFRNGYQQNDPKTEYIKGAFPFNFPQDWKITDWNSDWYKDFDKYPSIKDYYEQNIQARRYGGDLQGVLDKLDYIRDLGINALYFNPLNDSPSMHKYDARNYHHIDITFGPDPEGDKYLISTENPIDPKTWKFTSADKLFLKLIKESHERGIHIIMDYSWNHTGAEFWAWQDILKNGKNSKYASWYEIESFDDPNSQNGLRYTGWAGVSELPELKEINVSAHQKGQPYSGNLLPVVKQHIFDVSKRWLDPDEDGDFSDGIDGFRLDVADELGMDFWRDYRRFCRSVNPDCFLVGEVWWEEFPDRMMNPMPYLQGDVFDAVMLYQSHRPVRNFFAKSEGYAGAETMKLELENLFNPMMDFTKQCQMMMSASHDTERLLTGFFNRKNKFKFQFKPVDNPEILTGKPDEETFCRTKNYLVFKFTYIGSPQIWAGDEMGMWGTDDPDDRKPLWWEDIAFESETNNPFKPSSQREKVEIGFNRDWHDLYKKLIGIRRENPVLSSPNIDWLITAGDLLIYKRKNGSSEITVAINNSNEEMQIPKNLKIKGTDLLSGKQISNLKELKPLEAVILRK